MASRPKAAVIAAGIASEGEVKGDNASGGSASSQIHLWRWIYRLAVPEAQDSPRGVAFTRAVLMVILCVPISILQGVPLWVWPFFFPVIALIGFVGGLLWQIQRNRSGF